MLLISELFVCNDPGRLRQGRTRRRRLNKPRVTRLSKRQDWARIEYTLVWSRIVEDKRRVEDARVVAMR